MRLISLETAFKEACDQHEHLKLLESQWRFDKELIAKALQNIVSIFPHYSRHDSSHSKQIIVNIERILGNKINHLTATDMWLILEAAYCHDIGMVITHQQIKDMDTADFRDYVQDIANKPEHEYYQFALNWTNGEATLPSGSAAHLFFDEYRQLLAEWYRKKHPENSSRIINSPFEEIGLTSPRNELLPTRLFGVLAAICNAHGQSFEQMMDLPFSEAGMATEDCHPRYVASLLRIGDLLDVDDNRFCPVMMRMSGESLPAHSHAHLEKHQGIKHFRLDSERIKVEVTCPSPESYEVAHDWFKWLEKEYHQQSQHWPKIVPNKKLGRLPTLSPPKVTLKLPYLIINEGKKPSFDINKEAVLALLRSTGLYNSKIDSIREILQNAVDSTIMYLWINNKDHISKFTPSSPELLKLYDENMVSFDLLKNPKTPEVTTLIIKDKGMGISKLDLQHMLTVGNSSNNNIKTRLIREMPVWFRPSGNFGIGLQSIYLLSNTFTITTKSRLTNDAYRLTFSSQGGNSLIIESLASDLIEYGATVSLNITLEAFPERITMPFGKQGKILLGQMNDYDFTKNQSDLRIYEQIKIYEAILNFSYGSPIKIKETNSNLIPDRQNEFFSKETNIILSDVQFNYSDDAHLYTCFRGQPFSDLHPSFFFVSARANFCGHRAMDFLTYNREKILPHIKDQAATELKNAILEYIDTSYDLIHPDQKSCAAAFYYLHSKADQQENYHHDLLNFLVHMDSDRRLTLSEVITKIKNGEITDFSEERTSTPMHTMDINDSNAAKLKKAPIATLKLLKLLGTKNALYWQNRRTNSFLPTICHWSNEDIRPFEDEEIKNIFSKRDGFIEIGKRMIIPAWGQYRKLAIESHIPWARVIRYVSSKPDYFVVPYTFDPDGKRTQEMDTDFISWVHDHISIKILSKLEITRIYQDFINEIESLFKEGTTS